ncbi:MAG: right-handed parallel beta-helix repeat-containing protein [Chloroflexota bacterium]
MGVFTLAAAQGVLRVLADPITISFESPTYTTGNPNGQDGFVFTGPYDVAIVSQSTYAAFGSQSLRMSNASASGSFGDMPFTKSTTSDAGESTVDLTSPWSNHTGRKNGFEAELSFASATGTPQPGLRITISPDRGDGARMGWAAIRDEAGGLAVDLQAYDFTAAGNPCDRFTDAVTIATGLDRTTTHTLKFVMRFAEGYRNDIVQIYVDGVLRASTPSWEEYFRFCSDEQGPSADGSVAASHAVDSLLFRISETGTYPHVPAYLGAGFLIDNITLNTVDAPAVANVFVRTDGSDVTCDGSTNASAASSPEGKCAFKTVERGVYGVDSGGTVNVGVGTFSAADAGRSGGTLVVVPDHKPVTIKGAGPTQTILSGTSKTGIGFGFEYPSHSAPTQKYDIDGLTIQDLQITNFEEGMYLGDTGTTPSNLTFTNIDVSGNGIDGIKISSGTANGGISNLTIDGITASNNGGGGPGRGLYLTDGPKTNVTVKNSTFNNNTLVGIDFNDGSAENAIVLNNHVEGNGDAGIGVLGPKTSMSVKGNTVLNNGRFGIEIKNADGLTSGTPTLIVEENTITRTIDATDARDHAGIAVMRRAVGPLNVNQPAGVLVRNNVVAGYHRKPTGSTGDGFGIVVAGTNMQVRNNIVDNNDVGIQIQAGNPDNPGGASSNQVQSTPWFDRDNASSYTGVTELNDIKKTNTIGLRAVGAVSNGDVSRNWWGSSSGPTIASNLGGAGATAELSNGASITFTPFLGHGTDTDAAIGFQPESTNILVGQLDQTFVRLSGSSTECDGSADVDFNASLLGKCAVGTVQKGVDNVKATGTVNIAGQTFVGAAAHVITSKSVNILGASRATTILDGFESGAKTGSNGVEFQNGVDGATVKKLTIRRWSLHGLIFGGTHGANVGSANIVVDDVESSDNGDTAFAPGTPQGSARGIVVWDGNKSNITITNSVANNNSLVGIETQDGTVANAIITGNSVTGNRDAGLGVLGPKTSLNISGNTVVNNGRFQIEVKNPDGPTSGVSTLIVENNAVARNVTATELRDHAGIVVLRRDPGALNVDQPAGVIVRNNNVAGIRANAPGTTGEGFCIVVEGLNMSVLNNNTVNCDVGIQVQKGNTANVQSTPAFDRGSAADFSGTVEQNNIATTNTVGFRAVGLTTSFGVARNWWGSATGPTHASNSGGTGSSVVGTSITFSPWLADGTDTNAALGFQPNLTPVGFLATQGINVAPTSGLVTTESGGQASFAVVLASQPSADVTIGLSSSNTNEGTVSPASLTFTAANWNVPQTATVTGVGLGAPNGNATYSIITAPAVSTDPNFNGLNPSDVSATNNAAPTPTISIADASKTEGDSGTSNMTFNVTLSQTSPHTIKVDYGTQDQTALGSPAGIDYVATFGTLTFNPGETTKQVNVPIVGDLTAEQTETFLVNLSNPSGATILDGQAVGTITDNEIASSACSPRPNITVQAQSVGGRQMQVTVKADTTAPNQANFLFSIQFEAFNNATVQMPGQASVGTSPITLTTGTKQIVFFVTQTDTTKAFQVPFTVTDGCGSVKKFVGGGKDSVAN